MTARIDALVEEARRRLPERPTAADLPALVARGALVVDIRPVAQRERDGELPGAIVIDRNVLEWRLDPDCAHRNPTVADLERELILVCADGFSSSLAALSVQELGFRRVADLCGGFNGWRARTTCRRCGRSGSAGVRLRWRCSRRTTNSVSRSCRSGG